MKQLTDSQLLDIYNGACLAEGQMAEMQGKPFPELKTFEVWKADYLRACEFIRLAIHGNRSLQDQDAIDKEIAAVKASVKKINIY